MAQMVKNLLAMRETWVRSLGQEDPQEEEIATHSSILGWRIPWTEEPGRLQSMGSQRVRHNRTTNTFTFFNLIHSYYKILVMRLPWWLTDIESTSVAGDVSSIPDPGRSPGEGNGRTLQYSCLENPMDSGDWQATVHGVAKSWTRSH